MLDSGKLDKRITIQRRTLTQDASGQPQETWRTFAICYANIKPLVGKDYLEASQLNNELTHDIEIRYRRGVKSSMRVQYNDRYFEIVAPPIDFNESRRRLFLKCKEVDTS